MSSRRSSHSEAAAAVGVGRARTGSGSSNRSGTGTSTSSKPTSVNASDIAANVSCHFRYTGCYLLVIISDGCDMLRQEQLCHALKLNAAKTADNDSSTESSPPAELASQLDALDSDWNRKFIEHTIQQIAKG